MRTTNILPLVKNESPSTKIWQDKINNLSPSFTKALGNIKIMKDTFGLCGLLCYHIMGHLVVPEKWRGIIFEPLKDKLKFEKFERLQKNGVTTATTPVFDFYQKHLDIFTRTMESVEKHEDLEKIIKNLSKNQKIYFAVVCNYPEHEGQYTHWLVLLETTDKGTAIIAGDLAPFKIRDRFVVEVDFNKLTNNIISTLEKSPTTNNSKALSKIAIESRARNKSRFTSNLSVATFN